MFAKCNMIANDMGTKWHGQWHGHMFMSSIPGVTVWQLTVLGNGIFMVAPQDVLE